jgi:outer membrane receptor protein involved in Fe transport
MRTARLILIISGLTLCSCICLRESAYDRFALVEVYSNVDSLKIYANEQKDYYRTPGIIILEKPGCYRDPGILFPVKSKKPAVLAVEQDTLRDVIVIKSKTPPAYWIGNLFAIPHPLIITHFYDVAHAEPVYPEQIYIRFDDSTGQAEWQTWIPATKGQLDWELSTIIGLNKFYLNTGTDYGVDVSGFSMKAGCRYYFTDRNSIGLSVGSIPDFGTRVYPESDRIGEFDYSSGMFIDLHAGHDLDRKQLDVGVQYTWTRHEIWEGRGWDLPMIQLSYHEQGNLGLSLAASYRVSNNLCVRWSYSPSFVAIHGGNWSFHYSYLSRLEMVARKTKRPPGKRAIWRPPSRSN